MERRIGNELMIGFTYYIRTKQRPSKIRLHRLLASFERIERYPEPLCPSRVKGAPLLKLPYHEGVRRYPW